MTDRIDKELLKMSAKQRAALLSIIKKLREGKLAGLDIKKLKGHAYTYRVRKGAYRLIFYMKSHDRIQLLYLETRSDTTYRD